MFNRDIFKKKEDKEKEREGKIQKMLEELDEKERERKELQRKIELQEQEEWVWVDGIKGMTKDMKGYDGFQFEVGKTYIKDGLIEKCKNGFHFSMNLEDTIFYYELFKENRFFKVKALVRKEDLDEYGGEEEIENHFYFGKAKYKINKLVSREIKIIEELSNEELFEEYKKMESRKSKWIEDIDDFKYCRKHGENKLAENKLNAKLVLLGINELLVNILTKDFIDIKSREIFVDYVEALNKEQLSRDVFIYLIIEEQKRILRTYGCK